MNWEVVAWAGTICVVGGGLIVTLCLIFYNGWEGYVGPRLRLQRHDNQRMGYICLHMFDRIRRAV